MSVEHAKKFLTLVQGDPELEALLQRFIDSRYADPIMAAAKLRGYRFTRAELTEALTVESQPDSPPTPQPETIAKPKQVVAGADIPYCLHQRNYAFLRGERATPILRHKDVWLMHMFVPLIFCALLEITWISTFYFDSYRPYVELRNQGVLVDGRIVDYGRRCNSRGSCTPFVTYRYTLDGVTYDETQTGDLAIHAATGAPVKVLVSPTHPKTTAIEGYNDPEYGRFALGLFIFSLLAFTPAIQAMFRYFHRGPKPNFNGQVVKGQLVEAEVGYRRRVRYLAGFANLTVEFVSPLTNQPVKRRVECQTRDLGRNLPPAVAPIAIYFVDDQTWWIL